MALTLESIKGTRRKVAPIMLIYGEHGLGKSTFASKAPDVVFIQTEDGLGTLNTKAFDVAQSYEEVIEALNVLQEGQHEFKTLAIDSLDWLENLINKKVAKEEGVAAIEDIEWGKGWGRAADIFRDFMQRIRRLRDERGMGIIITAHAETKRCEDPRKPAYDKTQVKVKKKLAEIVKESVEIIGYVTLDSAIAKEDTGFGKTRVRAIENAPRVILFGKSDAYESKTRWPLPNKINLSWEAFAKDFAKAQEV